MEQESIIVPGKEITALALQLEDSFSIQHFCQYPAALVKKVLVKSIRPETSWLRIQ